ncbi:MAG: hypothetical protein ACJZ38_01675 [Candidatus Pelagibacterales bacterium]|tara:strand:- start:86 stop:400 length:315 start_codon:yes stop_codon:yes gene_type:complete
MMKNLIQLILIVLFVSACASPEVVRTYQAGDDDLTCKQLDYEIMRTENVIDDAKAERGMTGTNVAATLFWLPGLAATFINVNEAIEAGNDRINHLMQIKYKKGC